MSLRSNHMARLFLTLALALPALLVGCGDDDNPADQGDGNGGDTTAIAVGRGTIDSLLSQFFPEVYSNENYNLCAAMLDDRYTFQRLPNNPDEPVENLIWDRDEELAIAKVLFDGTPNAIGQSVKSIALNINVGRTTPSSDPDEPAGEEWFDVQALVDLAVVLNDPTQPDQSGILNLIINSKQKFVVTGDGDSPGDWVVVRQEDQEQINRGVPGDGATESSSWSAIKSLFRVAVSGRGTIDELLTEYFPEVYERRLYADYANMLEPRYSFQKLADDPDQPVEDLFWDRSEELAITRRMFDGSSNGQNQHVRSITLGIQNETITPTFDSDEPDGEEWFDVQSVIDLVVVLNEPSGGGGTYVLNLIVDSGQQFIVAEDPDSPNEWVIVKQQDQARSRKAGGGAATEETSWGAVKSLFR